MSHPAVIREPEHPARKERTAMKPSTHAKRPDAPPGDLLGRPVPIQFCSLAGFRHHDAPRLWKVLGTDSTLTLERDANNPHDPDAVAILWKGMKLGYLPRGENFVAARLLDGKRPLSARIKALRPGESPNRRIRLAVLLH
jgi:hypothetical protein